MKKLMLLVALVVALSVLPQIAFAARHGGHHGWSQKMIEQTFGDVFLFDTSSPINVFRVETPKCTPLVKPVIKPVIVPAAPIDTVLQFPSGYKQIIPDPKFAHVGMMLTYHVNVDGRDVVIGVFTVSAINGRNVTLKRVSGNEPTGGPGFMTSN